MKISVFVWYNCLRSEFRANVYWKFSSLIFIIKNNILKYGGLMVKYSDYDFHQHISLSERSYYNEQYTNSHTPVAKSNTNKVQNWRE